MLQDIKPYKYNNAFISGLEPAAGDRIVCYSDDRILVKFDEDGNVEFPKYEEVAACTNAKAEASAGQEAFDEANTCDQTVFTYLFAITNKEAYESHRFFLLNEPEVCFQLLQEQGFQAVKQREIQFGEPQWIAFAGTTAVHFARWYAENRYCGKCGAQMHKSETERMLYCDVCGRTVYPRINPVVIVGVIDGERLLLTKYAHSEYKRYALVAGFVEAGETIEGAVQREVLEETGIHVKNIHYYKSQPWSLSDSLICGLFCELDGSSQTHLWDGELSVAEWISREDIPIWDEDMDSITMEMMAYFKKYGRDVCLGGTHD